MQTRPTTDDKTQSLKSLHQDKAQLIVQRRHNGCTFRSLSADLGLSYQRVQQIYYAELDRAKMVDTTAHRLSRYTQRRLLYALQMDIKLSDIFPELVASRLHDGDLRRLGLRVHQEVRSWISDNGLAINDGYYNYWLFDGLWKAHATHWSDGKAAPWVVDGVYKCCALSSSLARLSYHQTHVTIRLDDLLAAFDRIA